MSFETPLVFRDTQQDQSLSDVFHALRVLSTTVDQVFERIGKRADDEAARCAIAGWVGRRSGGRVGGWAGARTGRILTSRH